MSQKKAALLMFKGVLSEFPAEERAKIDAAKKEIEEVVAKHGEMGFLALAWAGAELAAKD